MPNSDYVELVSISIGYQIIRIRIITYLWYSLMYTGIFRYTDTGNEIYFNVHTNTLDHESHFEINTITNIQQVGSLLRYGVCHFFLQSVSKRISIQQK